MRCTFRAALQAWTVTWIDFFYAVQASRVVFGAGSLGHLEREVDLIGAQRALVLCTPEQQPLAEEIAQKTAERAAGGYAKAVMHVQVENANAATQEAEPLIAELQDVGCGAPTPGAGRGRAGSRGG